MASQSSEQKTLAVAGIITLVLTLLVVVVWQNAAKRSGTIVLPGGITYLGPSEAQKANAAAQTAPLPGGKIPVPASDEWVIGKGKIFPYAFSIPASLSLGFFPNDPTDSVTIFYANTNAQTNLFFRVESLQGATRSKPKIDYAQNWWRNYSGVWKGVESVVRFTNKQGLVGYRARYLNLDALVPFDHVFFEIPGRPELIIWMSGSLFDQSVFDRMVDSVSWNS